MAKDMVVLQANVELKTMDTESLKREFLACLELTEQSIRRLANIASILFERGEELPDTKKYFLGKWIGKISVGVLHEKAFIKFCANSSLLKRLEHLPLIDQVKLAEGEQIPVVDYDDGKIQVISKRAEELTIPELKRVFDNRGIRPVENQKKLFKKPVEKESKRNKTLFIDPDTNFLKLSNSFVKCNDGRRLTAKDLIAVLSERYKVDIEKYITKHAREL